MCALIHLFINMFFVFWFLFFPSVSPQCERTNRMQTNQFELLFNFWIIFFNRFNLIKIKIILNTKTRVYMKIKSNQALQEPSKKKLRKKQQIYDRKKNINRRHIRQWFKSKINWQKHKLVFMWCSYFCLVFEYFEWFWLKHWLMHALSWFYPFQ